MQLESIKLVGFKSFVDPTVIPIRSHMSAIVGPNGCGKSNVIDAVRWVVGESSAKQLRGQSMTDVIFNGTSTRKPVGKASVELKFNNNEGRLVGEYANYSEISIRRELEREGQSNYFINGTLCRRRDIMDILRGTGLGPRSYSIIEQGMISKLVEAKPEDLRVHLEELAGISKYKDRRRETETRMRHTRENLERLNDLRDELEKQLRHLKRQASAAERYKGLKEEERLLSAQTRTLQWQSMNNDMQSHDAQITEQTNIKEEKIAEQRAAEVDIEKTRERQVVATDTQNEVQKRYYGLGADIARIEQQIKHTQEQTQRWEKELSEINELWQELEENSVEQHSQIAELTQELATLSPESTDIASIASQAQETLGIADADMNQWQEQWEQFQQAASQIDQQIEVSLTRVQHYQQQLSGLQDRLTHLSARQSEQGLETLEAELEPLAEHAEHLASELEQVNLQQEAVREQVQSQREQRHIIRDDLKQQRQSLQQLESRFATLDALQQAALGGDDEQSNDWLASQELDQRPRLGKELQVVAGWEQAVETVLSGYFNAVCVDDVSSYVGSIGALQQGQITLVDRQTTATPSNHNKATTLVSQIQSAWPVEEWLHGIYIADSLESAEDLRSQLAHDESVITRDGVWLGPNWVRIFKVAQNEDSILLREQKLKILLQDMRAQEQQVETQEQRLQDCENHLLELETQRDSHHRQYQELSAAQTQAKAKWSAQQSRFTELQEQQVRLLQDQQDCQAQVAALEATIEEVQNQLETHQVEQQSFSERREQLLIEREQCRDTLENARQQAQQQQQRADELGIRLASNENQLALLQQTTARSARQMQQMNERREVLSENLGETGGPLESLTAELQEQLDKRMVIEQELRTAESQLAAENQNLRRFEELRQLSSKQLDIVQTSLQSLQMERQAVSVRQATIKEQLVELGLELDQIIAEMPQEANVNEWQMRVEKIEKRIQRLGPINLAAIDECDSLEERKNYLDQQNADLAEALETLESAIRKIDKETRGKFKDTFEQVNAHFRDTFPRVFGGGRAYLELTDDDLLTAGVIVKAQPPGKRNTTIHMLSGGEKALTAISLVFAMFRLNPAPFCILDEVDAPLDDANVGRFCSLVKEMSDRTQFIVISHNKVTIETANHLMGVTMQEAGVSRIVSVDMEQAMSMVD